jgi:hypothetical protein
MGERKFNVEMQWIIRGALHFGRQCKKKLRKLTTQKLKRSRGKKDEKQQRSWKAQKWGAARRICILLLVMYLNRKQI